MTSRSIETEPQTLFGHMGQFTSVLEQEENQSQPKVKPKLKIKIKKITKKDCDA